MRMKIKKLFVLCIFRMKFRILLLIAFVMNSLKSHGRSTGLSTKTQITLVSNITMATNSTLQAKTRKQTTATQNASTERISITKNSTLRSQTRKKTTTEKTTSKHPIEPRFSNWKDDLIDDDLHILKVFAGFQMAFGIIFFLLWIWLSWDVIFGDSEIGITLALIIGCIYVFPHFVCPILGFVSLNYEIRTLDDAKLSYNIFRTYAIITTYNIILVSSKK